MRNLLPLRADDWLSAAVDCLEFLSDELVVEVSRGLASCEDDLLQCKMLLYEVLAQHYRHTQQPPLLSNHVFDIHTGISELLGKKRELSEESKRHLWFSYFHICFCLWHLITRNIFPKLSISYRLSSRFLWSIVSEWKARTGSGGSAAEPEAAGLSQPRGATQAAKIHGHCSQVTGGQATQRGEHLCPSAQVCVLDLCLPSVILFQIENRMALKRSFSSAIVYSRRLSKGKVDLMVLFMMDNHVDLFKVGLSNFMQLASVWVWCCRRDVILAL